MRVLICGSRDYPKSDLLHYIIDGLPADTILINGGARGIDSLAAKRAILRSLEVRYFYPDWEADGKRAGVFRNQTMLDEGRPDMVLAFWDGSSRGTWDMVCRAKKAGVPTHVIYA